MSRLIATDAVFPALRVPQADVSRRIGAWLEAKGEDPRRTLQILARAGVDARHSVLELDEVFEPRGMTQRNAIYAEAAIDLAERAARSVLARVGLAPEELALITSVSCTGFLIPSLDAHLANRLPLGLHVRRMPLTLLGCAGGAMGISHTADWLAAHPAAAALVVAVELPSLSFQGDDLSMAHLVSSALFGDGAAATFMAGEEFSSATLAGAGPWPRPVAKVRSTRTRRFPGTLDLMGFRVEDTGFHMILDVAIPRMLEDTIWPEVEVFLADEGLGLEDVDHFLIHPGGRRILDTIEKRVGRGPEALAPSRAVLREYGNLSSASILAVLSEHERTRTVRPGQLGLMLAFGPSFNAEMILLEWTAWGS